MNRKSLLIWLAMLALMFVAFSWMGNRQTAKNEPKVVAISEFITLVETDQLKEVLISGHEIAGVNKKDEVVKSFALDATDLRKEMREHKVKYAEREAQEKGSSIWLAVFLNFLPIILIVVFVLWMMNRAQQGGGAGKILGGHNATKAKLYQTSDKTFADVAGIDEAVEEVRDLVGFLSDPKAFSRLGGRIPKGILLVGPSGTGKTLLGKAVAGEAKVPFLYGSASEFVEMFVGTGAARVRDLFEKAKKQAPCIVFIDELDAVGRKRGGTSFGGGHDEREQTLNQILTEMDGFEPNAGVIILAATNRPDVLDSALTRPGRFDRQVVVPPPDVRGREAILKVHARNLKLAPDVDFSIIARGTAGMTGADLEQILNEAALHASKAKKQAVDMSDVAFAVEKITMGPERRSLVQTAKNKRDTAYHEAGHTVVGWFTAECDPVHKVTIVPRGQALGVTLFLPPEDKHSYSEPELIARIKSLFGGRCAEDLVLGYGTTGASNDLERATDIAHRMVCDFGMVGEGLGLRTYGAKNRAAFLDYGYGEKDYGDLTASEIDKAIAGITDRCYKQALEILKANRAGLDALAAALVEKETLSSEEIIAILGPRPKA